MMRPKISSSTCTPLGPAGWTRRNSTVDTRAAAPPPTPLKTATSWGMAVMRTRRPGQGNADPGRIAGCPVPPGSPGWMGAVWPNSTPPDVRRMQTAGRSFAGSPCAPSDGTGRQPLPTSARRRMPAEPAVGVQVGPQGGFGKEGRASGSHQIECDPDHPLRSGKRVVRVPADAAPGSVWACDPLVALVAAATPVQRKSLVPLEGRSRVIPPNLPRGQEQWLYRLAAGPCSLPRS